MLTHDARHTITKTRSAVIWNSIFSVPLLTIYNFIAIILYRDLGGSALQVMLLIMFKPVGALFSLYWSAAVSKRQDRLISNVAWSGVLARIPFLFFPFVENPWYLVISGGIYWTLSRGGMPAWMEILKQNLPSSERGLIFSKGSAMGYLEGVVLAIGVGVLLDRDAQAWRWVFPLSAGIGMIGVFLQSKVPVRSSSPHTETPSSYEGFRAQHLVDPWRHALNLLKERPDFSRFQWGFMLCGGAMMVMQPALPIFFVDILGITYTKLAIAITICKGLSFAITSSLWGRWLNTANIFRFSMLIFFCVGFFPLFLIFAPSNLAWLYLAYILYGIAQSGSELIWHLSGPIFSGDQDSSQYSGVNVMTVGIRGAIVPPLGTVLCIAIGPIAVFIFAILLCGYSGLLMRRWAETTPLNPRLSPVR